MAKTQPVSSMTGFARREGGADDLTWTWEVKSVNGKSLDLRCRLPAGYEELDAPVRAAAARRLARGNLQVNLTVNTAERPVQLRVNEAVLDQLLELARSLEAKPGVEPPRLDGLLAMRGVVETVDEEDGSEAKAARHAALLADLEHVVEALGDMRDGEGARLGKLAGDHLDQIGKLVSAAVASAEAQPAALRAKLEEQLKALLEPYPAKAMTASPVSKSVGNVRNDEPALIEPLGPEPAGGPWPLETHT